MAALRFDAIRCLVQSFSACSLAPLRPALPARRALSSTAPSFGSSVNQRMKRDHLNSKEFSFLYRKHKRLQKNVHLDHCPVRKGVVQRCYVQKPKKPNSALRKVARIRLTTGHTIIAHIPGEGHNLQDHAVVLVKRGGYRDLGHVHHKVVRGALDCAGVVGRVTSRTKYGAKKPKKVVNA